MRRCQSWPLRTTVEWKYREVAAGYGFAPDPSVPSFVYGSDGENDDDMPFLLCGWCGSVSCCATHYSYCLSWRELSGELNLELPQRMNQNFRLNRHGFFLTSRRNRLQLLLKLLVRFLELYAGVETWRLNEAQSIEFLTQRMPVTFE